MNGYETNRKSNPDAMILSMFLFYPALKDYIWSFATSIFSFGGIKLPSSWQNVFYGLFFWVVVFICLFRKRYIARRPAAFIVYFVLAGIAIVSYYTVGYEWDITKYITYILPAVILGSVLEISEDDNIRIYQVSIVVVIISMLYEVYFISHGGFFHNGENMYFAYNVLPSVLVCVAGCIERKTTFRIISLVLAVGLILMLGSRGPIVCIVFFATMYLLKVKGFGKAVIGYIVVSTLFVGILFLFQNEIFLGLSNLANIISGFGFSSRSITMLLGGQFTSGNGRDVIVERILSIIKENPLAIRGLYADRIATVGVQDTSLYLFIGDEGTYAHNFFLEMIFDFGLILGSLFSIFLTYSAIKRLIMAKRNTAYIFIIFMVCGFVKLFFSGSFVLEINFYFWIGLMFNPIFFECNSTDSLYHREVDRETTVEKNSD